MRVLKAWSLCKGVMRSNGALSEWLDREDSVLIKGVIYFLTQNWNKGLEDGGTGSLMSLSLFLSHDRVRSLIFTHTHHHVNQVA